MVWRFDAKADLAALLGQTLSAMNDGIVILAPDERILLVNERVATLFRVPAAAVAGASHLADFLRLIAGTAGWDAGRTDRILDNHRGWSAEARTVSLHHHFDDGTVLAIVYRPLAGGGGVLTYRDITTEHRLGEAIEDRHRRSSLFRGEIAGVASEAADASRSADGLVRRAIDTIGAIADDSGEVVAAAQQSADSMRAAAAATERMIATIDGIAAQAEAVDGAAQGASLEVENAAARAADLAEGSVAIGQILDLVRSVAAQTRTLALNAAIEAARSGSAGAAFTVVANEVKALAQQTADAVGRAEPRFAAMRSASTLMVESNRAIGTRIAHIHAAATAASLAATSHQANARTIVGAIDRTAGLADQALANVERIDSGARGIRQMLAGIGERTGDVTRLATALSSASGRYLETVEAADAA